MSNIFFTLFLPVSVCCMFVVFLWGLVTMETEKPRRVLTAQWRLLQVPQKLLNVFTIRSVDISIQLSLLTWYACFLLTLIFILFMILSYCFVVVQSCL